MRIARSPRHINFHDRAHTTVRLSRAGDAIEVATAHDRPLIVDVGAREFMKPDAAGRDFLAAAQNGRGMTVTDWRDSHTPRVNGQKMDLEPAETARSAAVSSSGAVVGTDFFLRFIGRDGPDGRSPLPARLGDARPARTVVVVACFGDGTMRWYMP